MNNDNKSFSTFVQNNKLKISTDKNDNIVLENVWEDDSILLVFNKAESLVGYLNA